MSDYKNHGPNLPAYDIAVWQGDEVQPCVGGRARWSKKEPPPPVGTLIRVTMNGLGKAKVTGYFEHEGWLGLRCQMLEPPVSDCGHIFGPEYELLEA